MSSLPQTTGYTNDQIELIKNTVAVGATDNELGLFLQVCKNRNLDPFSRQIHFVKRAGKGTIQTGIDGFRAIAERTGNYAGNDDPIFDIEEKPTKATVTVWKMVAGQRCPFAATARWSQYFPGDTQGFMWKKMPHVMLGKCAEALALRKAFPEALSGLYSDDEMQQAPIEEQKPVSAEVVQPPAIEKPKKPKPTPKVAIDPPFAPSAAQLEKIRSLSAELKATVDTSKLTSAQADLVIQTLETKKVELKKQLDSVATKS